ncbi:MAG TPA: GNAT family N-acetyltransferase [Polyangia bacterium]|nr:GNAT family N-acetyltransferase [Polyangia bacterium]
MTPIILGPDDEPALERFLAAHADSSMFLRFNAKSAGLVDRGGLFEGTYAALRDGRGEIVAVAAHYWSGNLMVQGRLDAIGAVARAAIAHTAVTQPGRDVRGFHGPHALVVAARDALGLGARATRLATHDDLFALALADLRVPALLAHGRVVCRHLVPADADVVTHWGEAYRVETLGAAPTPVTPEDIEEERRAIAGDAAGRWGLVDGERLVAVMRFTAALPDCVQVGGVYTPPALRGRGYARAVVAGALVEARAAGATRSILFTERSNHSARAAYQSLGYAIVGDYSIVLFA